MVFRRHDGRMAEVEAGALRMKVPLADIVAIEKRAEAGENWLRCDGSVTRNHGTCETEQ